MAGIHGKSKRDALEWTEKFTQKVACLNLKHYESTPNLFMSTETIPVMGVYFRGYDILLIGQDLSTIERMRIKLTTNFELKELGDANGFLGLNISQTTHGIKISLDDFMLGIREEFGLPPEVQPCPLPIPLHIDVLPGADEIECDRKKYCTIIKRLRYAAYTVRYDICYIVLELSRNASRPKANHMKVAVSVLRYISGSRDFSISYSTLHSANVICYTAASFREESHSSLHALSGSLIILGAPISWNCKVQESRPLSVVQAELEALKEAREDAATITGSMCGLIVQSRIKMFCENWPAICLVRNDSSFGGVGSLLIPKKTPARVDTVSLDLVRSTSNCAQLMTKPLSASAHYSVLNQIRELGQSPHTPGDNL